MDARTNGLITKIGPVSPTSISFSHDATRLAVGSGLITGATRLYALPTGGMIGSPVTTNEPVYTVEWSPDDLDVISYCTRKGVGRSAVVIASVATNPRISSLKQNANVYRGRVTPDGLKIVTECVAPQTVLQDSPFDVRDSNSAVPPGMLKPGDQIRVWGLESTGPAVKPFPHRSAVETLVLDPSLSRVVTAGGSPSLWAKAAAGTARLWDRETGRAIGSPLKHDAYVDGALFTADGRHVLTWSVEGTLRVWTVADGRPVGSPIQQPLLITRVVVNRQGDRILTLCRQGGDLPVLLGK